MFGCGFVNYRKINVEAQADAHAEVVKALNSESHLDECLILFYQQTDLVLELVEGQHTFINIKNQVDLASAFLMYTTGMGGGEMNKDRLIMIC